MFTYYVTHSSIYCLPKVWNSWIFRGQNNFYNNVEFYVKVDELFQAKLFKRHIYITVGQYNTNFHLISGQEGIQYLLN